MGSKKEWQTVLEAQNLSFGYGEKPVLQDIFLSVREGDLLALMGPNGSGKTTLLKVLLGILAPEQGTVLLYNQTLDSYPPKERAKKVAYVPQQPELSFPLTVFELVSLGRYPHIVRFARKPEETTAIEEALALTDSAHLKDRKFATLSGGEKQKVLISRSLAQSTGILLLDEPTVHLDLRYQLQILKMLKKLSIERRATVVAVLHDVNLVSLFADRVVMLHSGKIYRCGTVREVMTEENIKEVFGVDMTGQDHSGAVGRYFLPRDPLSTK
ncbi:MAG: ABC transporter ATP-binding protein [Candidatus Binatia bacterium]